MVSMAAGAFLGDWMLSHAHRCAPVVPAAATAVVIAIARGTAHDASDARNDSTNDV
jgi:hypothetical protein